MVKAVKNKSQGRRGGVVPLRVPTTTTAISGVVLCPFHVLLLFCFGLKTPARVAFELSQHKHFVFAFLLQKKRVNEYTNHTSQVQAQSNLLQKKFENTATYHRTTAE